MTTDITFRGVDCEIVVRRYPANKQVALQLLVTETQEPYMTATSCLPTMTFAHNQTLIKNYSENKGIYEALLETRKIVFIGVYIVDKLSFVEFPLVIVSSELIARLNEDSHGNPRD